MAGFTLTEALPLMQGLASKVANPQDYLAEAVKWTGGQPFLIQRLLGIMEKELAGIATPENIAVWVENLVQERIVTNWESQDAPPHLTTIRDRVLSVEEKLRGRMLGCYQQVLADGELEDDRSEERSKLRLTGLVVRRDGRLVSYNPIYGSVFNDAWVERQLADLRPEFYASAFRAWQDAEEGQDQGFLLRGQALEEAEVWARGKKLSYVDEQFLRKSRKVEKLETSQQLAATEEANAILVEAEHAAIEREKRATRKVRTGIFVFIVTILSTLILGLWANKFVGDAKFAVENTNKQAKEISDKAAQDVKLSQQQLASIKRQSLKVEQESKQNIREAETKKNEAERKVDEANKNLAAAEIERENVDRSSQEQVASASSKVADALSKVKSSQLELKILNDGLNVAKLINSQSPDKGDLVRAVLLSIESVVESRSIQSQQIKNQAIKTLTDTLEQSREMNVFHEQDNKAIYFVASTNDKNIVVIALNKSLHELQLWDANGSIISTPKPLKIATYLGKLVVSTFTRNNKTILISGDNKRVIKLQDIQGNHLLDLKPSGTISKIRSATSIAISKDGSVIVAAYGDQYIRIWKSDIWESNQEDKFSENISFLNDKELEEDPDPFVDLVAIDAKGETIVSSSKKLKEGERLKTWKLNKVNKKYDESTDYLPQTITSTALAISPNGETVVGGTQQGGIFIFKVGKSDSVKSENFHSQQIRSIIFLNDFSFVTSSDDGSMGLWTITSSDMEISSIKLRGHLSPSGIDTVSSNSDGTIFSGSRDGTVRLWDIKPISTMNFLSDNNILKFACLRIKDHPAFRDSEKNDSICEKIVNR
jgi:WD40 repeat protein